MDLFDDHSGTTHQPLAFRMRPRTLEEYIGQEHIIGKGRLLRRAIQMDQLSSIILYGPPGTGKTTLARVIANSTRSHFSTLNAVLSGVKELRYEIEQAVNRLKHYDKRTILFIDEVHRWNKSQQDALLPHVENGTCILIGATTENPYFEVNPALVSRSRIFQLLKLTDAEMLEIARQALGDPERGYGNQKIQFEDGALEHLINVANGDARSLLNALELAVETEEHSSMNSGADRIITRATAEESIQRKAVLYDKEGDYHFDTISAFIKSIRGSDPDAALYWLAKMVHAGEHPSYIFRRLLISAAEDISLADPQAIGVILSDAQAFDRIGLPEGRFHLAHATLYAATAQKSNSTLGFFDALKSVQKEKEGLVPNHLKDTSRDGKGFGHGEGYLYPHAYTDHWVAQQYLPSALQGQIFYHPGTNGYEGTLKQTVLERREVQSELQPALEHDQNLTYSPVNRNEMRWIERTLTNQNESFAFLRDTLFAMIPLKRNHTVLITHPSKGFLVWEAIRRCPEGSTSVLCTTEEEKQYLDEFAEHLDLLTRPSTFIIPPHQFASENLNGIEQFDHIISYNPLSSSVRYQVHDMRQKLREGGAFSAVQLLPHRTSRLSDYIGDTRLKKLLREQEENFMHQRFPDLTEEEIVRTLELEGFTVCQGIHKVHSPKVYRRKEVQELLASRYQMTEDLINELLTAFSETLIDKEVDAARDFLLFCAEK